MSGEILWYLERVHAWPFSEAGCDRTPPVHYMFAHVKQNSSLEHAAALAARPPNARKIVTWTYRSMEMHAHMRMYAIGEPY
mmetsp:Transcript_10166/g.21634  ORF Transcript_10166/g.21634 Transcript_10166/m.21634 type:complete len:81 (-) Transcript_10166:1479-1721(-)|eukprot:6186795-Pleurochrysis_carterae.AAC.2